MNTPAGSSGEIGSYVQLQHQIHDALREQHPEWIEQKGGCPTCESYESRFAELLNHFRSNETQAGSLSHPQEKETRPYLYIYNEYDSCEAPD